jgi:hypothetical protein
MAQQRSPKPVAGHTVSRNYTSTIPLPAPICPTAISVALDCHTGAGADKHAICDALKRATQRFCTTLQQWQ